MHEAWVALAFAMACPETAIVICVGAFCCCSCSDGACYEMHREDKASPSRQEHDPQRLNEDDDAEEERSRSRLRGSRVPYESVSEVIDDR